jgi:hypothetical protein
VDLMAASGLRLDGLDRESMDWVGEDRGPRSEAQKSRRRESLVEEIGLTFSISELAAIDSSTAG